MRDNTGFSAAECKYALECVANLHGHVDWHEAVGLLLAEKNTPDYLPVSQRRRWQFAYATHYGALLRKQRESVEAR
jgi:hypothetical protein